MARKIILNFQDKDSEVVQQSKILIFLIVFGLLFLILTRLIILIPIIIVLIVLEAVNQNTNHGNLVFINLEKSILLEIKPKLKPARNIIVKAIKFSWQYVHFENDGSSTHENIIKLNAVLKTSNKDILVTQELSPWREIPENWVYKIVENNHFEEFRVNKGLEKLEKEIESSS